MNNEEFKNDYTQFLPQKTLIYLRGLIMLVLGVLISAGSLFAPGVFLLSQNNSWLPIASFIILLVGFLECFDTYVSRKTHRFIVNLQFAIMDTVFGALIFFGASYDASQLSLLIASFLIAKGLFRSVAAYTGEFPNAGSTVAGGVVSTAFGLLIWALWPSVSIAFLSIGLSIEIALRGWALIKFSSWLSDARSPQSS
ncbi:MAG: HdeD family acid-resistance protein [Gammaproteobacteria bacterium]